MNIYVAGPLGFVRLVFSFCLLVTLLAGCGSAPAPSGSSSGTGGNAKPLAISAVTPKDVPVGSSAVTIDVTGTGFTPTTVIQLSGVTFPTTYISSTEIKATIPASQLQTGTVLKLAVVDGTQVVAADTGNDVQVSNPVPTVSTLAPSSVLVNSPAGTITVTGTNFVSGITLAVNGSLRNTTYVSATQLTASLTADDFLSAAPLLLNAVNPQPGGGASGTIALVVANPAPTISSLSPGALNAGSAATVVNIVGTGFVAGTGVLVNGASRPATFVSATAMKVALTSADLVSAGTLGITAVNPAPGGGVSTSSVVAINNPAPGAITLTPASAIAGTGTAQITVTGSSFVPATVVYVNGQPRTTTYVNATQLVASLTSADLASAGMLSVLATNPSPGGGSTAAASLPVNNPAPGSITVTPNLVTTGNPTVIPITVTGANFVTSTVVQINGSSRSTTFISSTQLLSSLTVADQATAGSLSVDVFTPTPGGGMSSAASIAINNSALGAISLSPTTVPAGKTTDTIITVTGTGMIPGTGIQVNGSARATTYVSANQVSFVLPASDVSAAGRLNVTAVNPAPNYSVSTVATLTVATPTATPVITSLSPTSAIAGSPSFALTATGVGFTTACTLQWNNTALSTNYSYSTFYNPVTGAYTTGYSLFATVPASLLTTTVSASITANCPTAVTSISNAITFNVTNPPVPTVTSLSVMAGPIATDVKLTVYGTGFSGASTVSYNGQAVATTYSSSTTLNATITASQLLFPGTGKVTVTTPAPGGGTSNAMAYTAYVPIVSNSMIYNPVNGLLYLSIPASVGAPYGNSIVSMDPATGALGTPIPVGSEPNKLALTSDGKYLWVGLDGASGVRKVDLTINKAGLQFALSVVTNSDPQTALSLVALPGASDSVVVLQGTNSYYAVALGIYDGGVLRGTLTSQNYYSQYALQVDSSRTEIYAGGSGLYTYTYSSAGLTPKVTNTNSNISLASSSFDEIQLTNGKLYGDYGKIYDAEAGTLLGTMYQTGTTVAQGPTLVDTVQNKVFVLDNSTTSNCCYSGYNQIQIFSPDDFTSTGVTIPISVPYSIYNSTTNNTIYLTANRLVRWGSNGLALHTNAGIFTMQSNSVKDVSSTVADMAVTATASSNTTTGTTSTYTVTVTNNGPSTATDVALAIQIPSTGVLASATTTSGACATSTSGCNLGAVASGSTVTITVAVLQITAGTATLSALVSSSSTDNNSANDSGSASLSVTGSDYNLSPTLSSIAPNAIKSGSTDTTITVTGTNFVPGSTVVLGTNALTTTYTSSTQLSATVPAAQLANMGWSSVSVSSPAPGGGVSNSTPLTVYTVLSLGVNHIVYDSYSRKVMASVSTGSSSTNGSSLVAITPETAVIGTPLPLTSVPTKLALSDSGQTLYVANSTATSIVRYNMLTGTMDTVSIPVTPIYSYATPYPLELAVQPGSENTLAISLGSYYYGSGIYDYSTSTKTMTQRSSSLNYSSYTCMRFLDASTLFVTSDASSLTYFGVNANGLSSATGTTTSLARFNCFKIAGGKAFASGGGVAAVSSGGGVTQIGSFTLPSQYYYYSSGSPVAAPDVSLGQTFLPSTTSLTTYGYVDGILSYDNGNYLRTGSISLNIPTIEGSTNYTIQDLIRWGQDGLAVLTSTGHLYLVRGPFVVPQLLNSNTAATLTGSSASTINHGAGNTLITLTGSNFLPGVAVNWNGSYRTTTIVDATHLTVAIPASDLAAAGTASLTAVNPGATTSSALTITIQ
jgi:trimeric autotransporter adhesin